MTPRQPDPSPGLEPERGFVLAVLAQGVDADDELSELEELARTAGVEPVARLVQHRASPDPRTYVGKGKLDELKQAYARRGRGGAARRRRAVAVAAAPARERAEVARRRPDAADPRHLRAARRQRRGQAPGRARAARVHPPADARHVAAPRAPRRRRRHERPRRVAARDRPPHRAPPDLAAAQPAEGPLEAARRAPQGADADGDADGRARRVHERRQVDAAERAHRLRRLRAQPPVRDARPDDARLRARRPPLSRHRHRRLRPPPAASARRGLRGDARGDARRRPDPPRRRRLGDRGAADRADRRGQRRPARDRRGRPADGARR